MNWFAACALFGAGSDTARELQGAPNSQFSTTTDFPRDNSAVLSQPWPPSLPTNYGGTGHYIPQRGNQREQAFFARLDDHLGKFVPALKRVGATSPAQTTYLYVVRKYA